MNHILGSWCNHNKYSKCPSLAWTQARRRLRHWSMASSITFCCSPAQPSTSHFLHFFLVDPILHHSLNLAIYLVKIWAIRRPQIRWDECGRLLLQQLDCLACPVRQWFANINISQGSEQHIWGEVGSLLLLFYCKFPTEYVGERIMKICHYLAKIWTRV